MDSGLPQKIGRYEIQGELGRGMMGVVYEAHDPALSRSVALKTINPSFAASAEDRSAFEKRFETEARIAGRLSHPNIVVVHDVGRDEETGILYIALERLQGEVEGRAYPPAGAPFDQAVRIRSPALEHQAQIDDPFQRWPEIAVGQVIAVKEKSVLDFQATAFDLFQRACPRAFPQPALIDPRTRPEAELPVKLETAVARRRPPHLEPSVLREVMSEIGRVAFIPKNPGDRPHMLGLHEEIHVGQKSGRWILVQVQEVVSPLEKQQRDSITPHEASQAPELGQRGKVVHPDLAFCSIESRAPLLRESIEAVGGTPCLTNPPAALVARQRRLNLGSREPDPRRVLTQQVENGTLQGA